MLPLAHDATSVPILPLAQNYWRNNEDTRAYAGMTTAFARCKTATLTVATILLTATAQLVPDNTLQLQASAPRSASVGGTITLKAVRGEASDSVWYRFRLRPPDATSFRTVRDFSPDNTFEWVPSLMDGTYAVEVTAKDHETGETTSVVSQYLVTPRAVDTPVITPTANELVFLYSAPPCAEGAKVRIDFQDPDGYRQSTPELACSSERSVNVYLAGLRAETIYRVKQVVTGAQGSSLEGPELTLTTGSLRWEPKETRAIQKRASRSEQGVLLQSKVFEYSGATNLDGGPVWYCPKDIRYLTRPVSGGYFLAIIEKTGGEDYEQKLRQIDLGCNTVLETNAAVVNEQLKAPGKRTITSFHHEALSMPEGKIMALAATEEIFTDVQGPGEVDVIGDMIVVLNRDMQVEWVWDAFDHLDVRRAAILGETCTPGGGGCPEFHLLPTANDWLHGNSLQLTPDGNILYSARHQDWVIKIDYANGTGSGEVLWKLGKDGDFQMISDDPRPWFSHQHDANYEAGAAHNRIVLFDNGNTRRAEDETAHSRGQVLRIDEQSRTVRLDLNADLGEFARALGSAQRLGDGNYHFNLGWTPDGLSRALEFDPAGNRITAVETATQQYRSFRMKSLYEK
jgi:arylsulfate sulfotransferase